MNGQDRHLQSIRIALWTLVVLVGVASVGISVFFAVLTHAFITGHDYDRHTIIVANTNIPAGGTITKKNLAKKEMKGADLPKYYACPHVVCALLGHKVLEELKRGDPIVLSNTDLWIQDEKKTQQASPGDSSIRTDAALEMPDE